MKSVKTIVDDLDDALKSLNNVVETISELQFEPVKDNIKDVAAIIWSIYEFRESVYKKHPELVPAADLSEPEPDPPLSEEQQVIASSLTESEIQEIDNMLMSFAKGSWRKVAMLVGATMTELPNKKHDLPDVFYSERVRKLVEDGHLESQGNLQYMRYSEVRLPKSDSTQSMS